MPDIQYVFTRDLDANAVAKLFAQVVWGKSRTVDQIAILLQTTPVILAAFEGEALVGIARVITDDLFRAYIEDVIVDEAYRGRGIGYGLMTHLMERLEHVEEITFNCEDHLIPFYERFGFELFDMTFMHIWRGKTDE